MRLRCLPGLLLLALTTACLPIPNRVRDTPDLRGVLTVDGKALVGADVRVEPVKNDYSVPPIACGAGGQSVRTDSTGMFTAPAQRHWEPWVFLLGESPTWNRHWRICIFAARPGEPATWQLLWDGSTNLGPPLRLKCDIASPWKTDTLADWRGRSRHRPQAAAEQCI